MHASLPDVDPLIARLADAIAPTLTPDTVIVGIHTGGVWIAERLHALLHCTLPLGMLDISFYRDDFSRIGLHPQVKPSNLPFDLEGRNILLVDDVLHSGRTVRAAMNELFDYGRPASIRLAVLVDRGDHELPIRPDFTGLTLTVPDHQNINLSRLDDGHLTLSLA
jgi:pyrimidine operon attenuation protein/uracil phosphoribosyltransferase